MLVRFRESALRLNILENSYDESKFEKMFVENRRNKYFKDWYQRVQKPIFSAPAVG